MKSLIVLLAMFLVPLPALAYIDPASGSAIVSAVIGFFVAIALAIKTYWYKLKSFLFRQSGDSVGDERDGHKDTENI